jgi:hypothetical protein
MNRKNEQGYKVKKRIGKYTSNVRFITQICTRYETTIEDGLRESNYFHV